MDKPQVYRKQEMMKVSKIAKRWGCSRQHIYNLIDRGELPAFRFGISRCLFVPLPSVEDLERNAKLDPGA